MSRQFKIRNQALNAAEHILVNRIRVDLLPTLAQVKSMQTHDLISVLRCCPESDSFSMEHDDILEKYENKTQLRNDVIDLVRTMSAAYDIYSIAECTERSTQSEMERAE